MAQRREASSDFEKFFTVATRVQPFPFQREFALGEAIPEIVQVPTGLGKTAMAVVGWLWRRLGADEGTRKATPRRLVYCLPMRVLVEQTAASAREFIKRLRADKMLDREICVHVLMGGEDEDDWDIHPENDVMLVGTQDMLLSRALNRGYAATRSRWPMQFGLLHTDCLWVFDEIQLMGAGLASTSQLEAFRRLIPADGSQVPIANHGCRSVWMSATMRKEWLATVDYRPWLEDTSELAFKYETEISKPDLAEDARKALKARWEAPKPLLKSEATMADPTKLAAEVLARHRAANTEAGRGTLTIVVVNTVKRACDLREAVDRESRGGSSKPRKGRKSPESSAQNSAAGAVPRLVLLHSRFRPEDRRSRVEEALASPGDSGTIVVSTQVIEAGVDLSATTLFTELAPWASLVQRFGRCNRTGNERGASIHWIDLPPGRKGDAAAVSAPYDAKALSHSREQLLALEPTGVGLMALPDVDLPFEHVHVIRRRDLIDLFDTTPDLAGNDIDIDRFVREVEESDVRAYWRGWDQPRGHEAPPEDFSGPKHGELCPVPIGSDTTPGFRQFLKNKRGKVWRWSFLDKRWEPCTAATVVSPGQVFLVHSTAGGYSPLAGWDLSSSDPVGSLSQEGASDPGDSNDDDRFSRIGVWQTIAEHTAEVSKELRSIAQQLSLHKEEIEALRHAAHWHDRGKAHRIFQDAVPTEAPAGRGEWAKAPRTGWQRYARRHFRHEMASALAVLDPRNDVIPSEPRDLVAYLVAAHHGKVRLSIRSLPGETRPDGGRRFARGIWDGDELPEVALDEGNAPAVKMSLEPMELGLCQDPPYEGLPSWTERMLGLRDTLGPFRLAYLEALLRAADMRASRKAEKRADEATP